MCSIAVWLVIIIIISNYLYMNETKVCVCVCSIAVWLVIIIIISNYQYMNETKVCVCVV